MQQLDKPADLPMQVEACQSKARVLTLRPNEFAEYAPHIFWHAALPVCDNESKASGSAILLRRKEIIPKVGNDRIEESGIFDPKEMFCIEHNACLGAYRRVHEDLCID